MTLQFKTLLNHMTLLGAQYGITREMVDEYSLSSQLLYQKANEAGVYKAEIAPMEVKGKKGVETVDSDENPRAGAKLADLQKLKSIFQKEGLVTAGTASGISDGAASLIVASEAAVKEHGN
jgi:acetyl-CoA acyltransferase 2